MKSHYMTLENQVVNKSVLDLRYSQPEDPQIPVCRCGLDKEKGFSDWYCPVCDADNPEPDPDEIRGRLDPDL
jgi:rubrerythrin